MFVAEQPGEAPRQGAAGFHMIRSVSIRNFRCYKFQELRGCSRLNVIVGDNGSGKTSLLESIFLPLSTGSEVAMRLRQQRGLDGMLGGTARRIEEAVWGDLFHDYNLNLPISLAISGDGPENRSLEISKGVGEVMLPFPGSAGASEPVSSAPVVFTWTDAKGGKHPVVPRFAATGVTLPDTGEDMPDFYFFPATQIVGSVENASRFSELSKANQHRRFVKTFTKEYPWIKDLNVEVHAGSPTLFATLLDSKRKIPVANVSTGINRVISFMLAVAVRPRSIVLIDEIENGVYYTHFEAAWITLLSLARQYETQLFISTHSRECLEALAVAAGNHTSDIAIWRTERAGEEYKVIRFDGETFKAGIEYGQEVR
jgi:ABC-type lipoprotein export system ATPase subunit